MTPGQKKKNNNSKTRQAKTGLLYSIDREKLEKILNHKKTQKQLNKPQNKQKNTDVTCLFAAKQQSK